MASLAAFSDAFRAAFCSFVSFLFVALILSISASFSTFSMSSCFILSFLSRSKARLAVPPVNLPAPDPKAPKRNAFPVLQLAISLAILLDISIGSASPLASASAKCSETISKLSCAHSSAPFLPTPPKKLTSLFMTLLGNSPKALAIPFN